MDKSMMHSLFHIAKDTFSCVKVNFGWISHKLRQFGYGKSIVDEGPGSKVKKTCNHVSKKLMVRRNADHGSCKDNRDTIGLSTPLQLARPNFSSQAIT